MDLKIVKALISMYLHTIFETQITAHVVTIFGTYFINDLPPMKQSTLKQTGPMSFVFTCPFHCNKLYSDQLVKVIALPKTLSFKSARCVRHWLVLF